MIRRVTISNYKSFADFSLDLEPFNVIVGPNASGKTNFIDVFRFLQESLVEGIDVAASRRGGWTNIRSRKKYAHQVVFTLEGVFRGTIRGALQDEPANETFEVSSPSYGYTLVFGPDEHPESDYVISHEQAQIRGKLGGSDYAELLSEFERDEKSVSIKRGVFREEEPLEIPVPDEIRASPFVTARFYSRASLIVHEEALGWDFYDPNPFAARSPSDRRGVIWMSESGDTLALVLHDLSRNDKENGNSNRSRLRGLMQHLVPGFKDWRTHKLPDGRIKLQIEEDDIRGYFLPAQMSDGTIRLLTILAALIGVRVPRSTVFIEEPERSLHPLVLEQLVEVMREVSRDIQIVVTTHSGDLVRACNPSEVILLDKKGGLTRAIRANTIDQIDHFLEHFTLDQLWLQGHLGLDIP